MRVIIAGSRTVTNYEALLSAIRDSGFVISEVVSGGAAGADALGERWALENSVPLRKFPADWATHGRAAGPIRNTEMAQYADALIAIWDGASRGTANMISTANRRGLRVHLHPVY